jgi:hypothetical protein
LDKNDLRSAAIRAIDYVALKPEKIDPMTAAALLELNQKFALKLDAAALGRQKAKGPIKKTPFWRFADDSYIASELEVHVLKGPDRVTAIALYCDKYPLPWDYYTLLDKKIDEDGFMPTRAMMALGLLSQRRCPYDKDRVLALLTRARAKLAGIIVAEKSASTLAIEAMLFLSLAGFGSDIKPAWVTNLLRAQKSDGSFLQDRYSTLLAGRFLLEYQNSPRR